MLNITVLHYEHSVIAFGAGDRTRTGTVLPPLAPEASASTNFATPAIFIRLHLPFFSQTKSGNVDEKPVDLPVYHY